MQMLVDLSNRVQVTEDKQKEKGASPTVLIDGGPFIISHPLPLNQTCPKP